MGTGSHVSYVRLREEDEVVEVKWNSSEEGKGGKGKCVKWNYVRGEELGARKGE